MTWMRNAALGLVLLALLGAAPLFPTEQSQRLADAFSERVRALEVTFNVPGLGLRNHVRTAVALAADEAGTWWLTAPAALSLPGHVDATLAKVQLSDSEASVTVRAVVDDFSGTYALLLESQDRGFAPLAVRPLLPMHGLQWAGLLYAAGARPAEAARNRGGPPTPQRPGQGVHVPHVRTSPPQRGRRAGLRQRVRRLRRRERPRLRAGRLRGRTPPPGPLAAAPGQGRPSAGHGAAVSGGSGKRTHVYRFQSSRIH